MSGTVLLRRGALGDVVLLGAVTGSAPGPVTVCTHPRLVGLASRLRGVDQVVPWGEPDATGAALPGGTWVDLHRSLRSRALLRHAPGPVRRLDKRSVARRARILRLGGGRPWVGALYAEAAGVPVAPLPWIARPDVPRRGLALVPGASTPLKQPSAALLVQVGRRWDGPVVVLGGPDEVELVQRVARATGGRAVAESGFAATLEALAGVAVAVGGDTGLVHLARASGAPVVVLYGATHPDDGFFAYPDGVDVVQRRLACRPCTLHSRRRCLRGDRACLDHDLEAVWQAVRAG